MRVYVIDSSAIFFRKRFYSNMVTVPEVIQEIKDEKSVDYLSIMELEVKMPDDECVNEVLEVAKQTGDIHKLSNTDIKLLALALTLKKEEKNPIIVTDDYSIQNVAINLHIETDSIVQTGISKAFKWVKVCKGCRRIVNDVGNGNICPICGSEVLLSRVK